MKRHVERNMAKSALLLTSWDTYVCARADLVRTRAIPHRSICVLSSENKHEYPVWSYSHAIVRMLKR